MTLPQQSSQQQSQHFLLKWNNHRSNMVNVFESLLQSENLVDVTIAVEGKFLKAHKIVLSACSPYFQAMFVNHTPSERYPVLLFHDMKFQHLKTLLDFMYRGEISIDEKDLGEVLKVAEALSIRGLSSFESDDEESEKSESQTNTNNPNINAENSNHTMSVASQDSSANSNHNQAQTSTSSSSQASRENSGSVGGNSKSKGNASNKSTTGKGKFSNAQDNHTNSPPTKKHHVDNGCVDNRFMSNSKPKEKGASATTSSVASVGNGGIYFDTGNKGHSISSEGLLPPPPPVKRKRGRQPKNKMLDQPAALQLPKSPSRLQSRFAADVKPPVPRQGVRRRLPRRFPGVPTRLKRVKLSKHDQDLTDSTALSVYEGGDEALLQDMMDGTDCEPLSEMSVRGLDLFKYASIEDGVYRCIECEKLHIPKTFKNKYSFQRHAFLYHEGNMRKVFPCPVCSREFSRPDKMKNHMRSIHEDHSPKDDKDQGRNIAKVEPDNENDSCDSQNLVN